MNGRSDSEVLASVETHIEYISNHLQNIDTHLERLNGAEDTQNKAIERNTTKVNMIIRIGGGVLTISATIAAITLGIMQLFN